MASTERSPNDAIADEARSADLIVIGSERNSNNPFYSLEPGIGARRVSGGRCWSFRHLFIGAT